MTNCAKCGNAKCTCRRRRSPFTGDLPGAPAIIRGIQAKSVEDTLKNATPEQIKMLTHHNFALWAQFSGLEVDQKAFTFDRRRYLLDLYMCNSREMAWMKSAQMGATIYEVLRLLWFCRYHPVKAALYFPTADGVTKLAKDRLNPIISTNAELRENLSDGDALGLKHIRNVHGKQSSLYMLYLGGTASKDSVPLDILGFDEVRLCDENDIDQAIERVSASSYKYKMYVSTAGFPGMDIARRFEHGDQQYWHVRCACEDGFIPSEEFPNCILDLKGGRLSDAEDWWDRCVEERTFLQCPRCKMVIKDPQNGMYIPHNPGGAYPSFHISQLISHTITPYEIIDHFNRAVNKKEFYNAKLGKPYVDEENVPITETVLERCVNTDIQWGYNLPRKERKRCAMGVDQHGGNCYVVVVKPDKDGVKRIMHLEIIDSANPRYTKGGEQVTPFKRVYELARHFDIGACVIDGMPNYNEAAQMTRDFRGRCWVAWYGGESQKDMVTWADRARTKEGIRKGSANIKTKYQVFLNRYTSMDYSLSEFVNRNVVMPHPDGLVQVCRSNQGRWEADAICRNHFWLHLKSLVRKKTPILTADKEDTGRFRMEWVYLGLDPHFAHAWNYCNIAAERMSKRPIILL